MAELDALFGELLLYPTIVRTKEGSSAIRLIPDAEDARLNSFSVNIFFPLNSHITLTYIPGRFSREFVSEIGKADEARKESFYANLFSLSELSVSWFVKINNQRFESVESLRQSDIWTEEWTSFGFQATAIFDSSVPKEEVIVKAAAPFLNAVYSLAYVGQTDEDDDTEAETEGNPYEVRLTRYERSRKNRELCLKAHGYKCAVCGMDFYETYGEIGKNFIEVHHIVPVYKIGPDYQIDPVKDLIPVCPNCHAMLHRRNPPFTPDELKKIIKKK